MVTAIGQIFWSKFKRKFFDYLVQIVNKPRWFLMFSTGRIQCLRSLMIFILKRPYKCKIHSNRNSLFEKLDVDKVVQQLRNNGLYLGVNLPQPLLQEILEFSSSTNYLGNAGSQTYFFLAEKEKEELRHQSKFVSAHHLNPSSECPAVKNLEHDPKLWTIAAEYLETTPVLMKSWLRWTFATEATVSENVKGFFRFHYDLEDYRFIKFMFYLTDVDSSNGPHVCVKGSHKKKKLQHQFSLIRERDDQEIINYYGIESVETICGTAGFGFVEDFYCFHKATLPVHGNRLILEVKFAMNDYGS